MRSCCLLPARTPFFVGLWWCNDLVHARLVGFLLLFLPLWDAFLSGESLAWSLMLISYEDLYLHIIIKVSAKEMRGKYKVL